MPRDELADIRAIERVLYGYCRAVDTCDLEALGRLFAAEGTFETTSGRYEGREAIVECFRKLNARAPVTRMHYVSNVDVALDSAGTRAKATSLLLTLTLSADDGRVSLAGGTYDDELVLEDDRWLLVAKRATLDIPFTAVTGRP